MKLHICSFVAEYFVYLEEYFAKFQLCKFDQNLQNFFGEKLVPLMKLNCTQVTLSVTSHFSAMSEINIHLSSSGPMFLYCTHGEHQKNSFVVFSADIKWEHWLLAESTISFKINTFLVSILKN